MGKKIKKEIREKFLAQRNILNEKQIQELSLQIKRNLYSMQQFKTSKTILIYTSKGSEVCTHEIMKEILNGKLKEKKICVPHTTKEKIIPSLIENFDELKLGMFNILEPKVIIEVPKDKIDLIIIPGVAFDKKGNRIGYGKGYFDKFLRWINCPKVGLGFEIQISSEILPQGKSDVALDFIVTEKKIIPCKK